MATKKNTEAKQSTALAKRGSTAITNWEAELAKHAADVAAKEQMPTGQFASIKGGILSIAGSPMKENKVRVVIIDHVYENAMYAGEYDPDNVQPPACYAFGREEDQLAPHEKAHDKQHDACTGCAMNVFGSADKGKGKACKNTRRLAMLSADGLDSDSVEGGEVVYMKLPVTSVKAWAFYVKGLATTLKRPPFGVVTEIAVVPDAKTQFKVTFQCVGNVDGEVIGAIMARREKVGEEITFPYGDPKPVEEKPAKGKGKAAPAGKRRF